MKNLFKKIFISTLSFVMMFACAFTFTTNKASASTNADVPARSFTQSEMADFGAATGRRIAGQYSGACCLILDNQLFDVDDITITQNSTLNDIVGSSFLSNFTYAFGLAAGFIDEVDDTSVTVEEILEEAEMQIVVYVTSRTYINLTTGVNRTNVTYLNFYNRLLDNNSCNLYSAIVWETPSQLYSLLYDFQYNSYSLPIYAFPREEINFGNGGLGIIAWLGGDEFYD